MCLLQKHATESYAGGFKFQANGHVVGFDILFDHQSY